MKRAILYILALSALALCASAFVAWYQLSKPLPIKVGILHSLTGTMAISEKGVVDATLLAIDEVNERGGVLGRQLLPLIYDGASDWPTFAKGAEQLIAQDVAAIFGCWTSASRKTVKPVVEKHKSLLLYPVQYEGLEQSPHIFYGGSTPNQQILPAITWATKNLGNTFFLVGSDYIFPHAANEIIKDQIAGLGGSVVGEEYILLGSSDVDTAIAQIVALQPQVIINTINGDTNVAFFKKLRAAGITPEKVPTISFSIAEQELHTLGGQDMAGDYAVWSYFQSILSPENTNFVASFKKKYGSERVLSDPMEAAYTNLHLWAQAAAQAKSTNVDAVLKALPSQSLAAPEGIVYPDAQTQHLYKAIRIGKIRKSGQFTIVWESGQPVQPVPYPPSRTKQQWQQFVTQLYKQWGNKWSKEA